MKKCCWQLRKIYVNSNFKTEDMLSFNVECLDNLVVQVKRIKFENSETCDYCGKDINHIGF